MFFSTFFCVFYRFVSVFLLTYIGKQLRPNVEKSKTITMEWDGVPSLLFFSIANRKIQRVRLINFEEQLLMAYGGLRGAIAFSLATLLEEAHVKHARIFITTSLFIVLFTVFVRSSLFWIVLGLIMICFDRYWARQQSR